MSLGSAWGMGIFLGLSCIVVGLIYAPKPNLLQIFSKEKLGLVIPLGIIVGSAILGMCVHNQPGTDALYLAYLLLCIYLCFCSTACKKEVLAWLVLIAFLNTASVVVEGLSPQFEGGRGATGNSGLAGTLLGLAIPVGFLVLPGKWKWLLIIPLVGVFFTGDHWTWIALAVVFIIALVRQEVLLLTNTQKFLPKGLVLPALILVILVLVGLQVGFFERLYRASDILATITGKAPTEISEKISTLSFRTTVTLDALKNTAPLGHGVQFDTTKEENNRYNGMVHNVPVMIWDDLGPLAGLAWIFLIFRAIVKSRTNRYVLLYIFIASLFGYWFWWPLGLSFFTWLVLGMSEPSRESERLELIQKRLKGVTANG